MYPTAEEEERIINQTTDQPSSNQDRGILLFIIIAAVFLISIFLVLLVVKRGKKKEEEIINLDNNTEKKESEQDKIKRDIENEFPESLDGIIKIIKENGGRVTQKDIRKRISLSEAKISLMITELEHKGIVERIKKGRGNIIILRKDPDSEDKIIP
jgi:uncharacterized membrane protein